MLLFISILMLSVIHLFVKDHVLHWYIFAFAKHLIILILSYRLYITTDFLDYKNKIFSYLIFVMSIAYATYALFVYSGYLIAGSYNDIWFYSMSLLLSITILLIAINSRMTSENVTLDNDYIFILYRKPFCNITILPSLLFNKYGSAAIYCRGKVYGFRKNETFKRLPTEYANKYLKESIYLRTNCTFNDGLKVLQLLNGTKWSINNNCFTMANKFKGK